MLGINIENEDEKTILEKIEKYLIKPEGFFQIVSLNPENLVVATEDETFNRIVREAQIKIVDGVGVVLAGRVLGVKLGPRFTGVDLMKFLLKFASDRRLTVALVGGGPKIAEKVVDCQSKEFSEVRFIALEGISDIYHPKTDEEEKIFSIVARHKPQFLFAAFGSPFTEIWLDKHKKQLSGIVVMSVGGAFDYLSGNISRAPKIFRLIGLEWLYRLVRQPWRYRRQLRLFKFIGLILKERIKQI